MRLTTCPMELVSLVVLREKAEDAASYLLHSGFFHPVDIRDVESELKGLSQVQIAHEYENFDRLQQRAFAMARQLGIELKPASGLAGMYFELAEEQLKRIEDELTARLVRKEELRQAVGADEAVLSQAPGLLPFPIPQARGYSLLFITQGTVEEKNIPVLERSLETMPHVLYVYGRQKGKARAVFLGLRQDRITLQKVLADVGWQEEEPAGKVALPEEEQSRLRARVRDNKAAIQGIDKEISEFKSGNRENISRVYSYAVLNKSLAEAKRYAVSTDKTIIFSGWVPAEDRERVMEGISSAVSGSGYIESRRPEDTEVAKEEIPVLFGESPLLKPFSLLVGSYGVPRYGTVDPTVFVAIGFVFMFGLMFGDLGQGLVFALAGAFLLWKNRIPAVRQFAALLTYCGTSAALFGLLEGSAFGLEFHSLFKEPLNNVGGLLTFSVYAGIVMISVGIVINIINAFRDRAYVRLLFDKAGLVAGLVYWAAIAVVIRTMFERAPVPAPLYALIIAGIAALFLFPMVEFFLHARSGHGGGEKKSFLESFMESLLGLLEFAMGFLANTVSFVRMGAFALAHAALLLSIFQIARMFSGGASLAVIVLGNIGVMVLEGVVVSIQSLRLTYYEFFSKFFLPGRAVFKPLSVRYNG